MKLTLLLIILGLACLTLWEVAGTHSPTVSFFISTPSKAVRFAVANTDVLWNSTVVTAIETVSGFLLATALSVGFMILCLYWPPLLRGVLPIFVASQILPMITLAPLFIVLFGMGMLSKIAMVVLMCFFPIFINFAAGVAALPRHISELLFVYSAKQSFRVFHVTIPLSLPHVFVGLRVSTTMAVMGAIVAEFMGARAGLGKNLYLAPKSSQPELMICSISLVLFLGIALYRSISFIEKRFCAWNHNNILH